MFIQKRRNPYNSNPFVPGFIPGLEDAFAIDWQDISNEGCETIAKALEPLGFDLVHYITTDDNYVLRIVKK
jgi:hypothetical protein